MHVALEGADVDTACYQFFIGQARISDTQYRLLTQKCGYGVELASMNCYADLTLDVL